MKITGYQIKDAIKQIELIKTSLTKLFPTTLKFYEDAQKKNPEEIINRILDLEIKIVKLQALQADYNSTVKVQVGEETISLCQAIKQISALIRVEALWKTAADQTINSRNGYSDVEEIDPTKVLKFAKLAISPEEALIKSALITKKIGQFKTAIATGNAKEVNIKDVDDSIHDELVEAKS